MYVCMNRQDGQGASHTNISEQKEHSSSLHTCIHAYMHTCYLQHACLFSSPMQAIMHRQARHPAEWVWAWDGSRAGMHRSAVGAGWISLHACGVAEGRTDVGERCCLLARMHCADTCNNPTKVIKRHAVTPTANFHTNYTKKKRIR
jgi:hypothetical protein